MLQEVTVKGKKNLFIRKLNCDQNYVTDTLDKTNDKVDEADVDTLEAGIGSTFGQNYTVND